jgi:2-polyprenyl-3-methyl-5-hydroxy-6-metoxy-1,4-benzoquinol methylase
MHDLAECTYGREHTLEYWCSASDQEYMTNTEPKVFNYFECLNCQTLVVSPMLVNNLEEIYPKNYYSFHSDSYNFLYKIKFKLDKAFMKKTMLHTSSDNLKILDIGGGTGKLASLARLAVNGEGTKTYVVDLDEEARFEAEKDGHVFSCSTFENWESREKMDLILAYNILEHVPDPRLFLRKMSEILSQDGRIILQTPNYKALDAKIFRKLYWGGLHTPRHFYVYSKNSLTAEIERAHLKVIHNSSTQAGHFWVCSILGTLQKLSFLKYKKPMYARISYKILMPLFVCIDFARIKFSNSSQQLLILGKG